MPFDTPQAGSSPELRSSRRPRTDVHPATQAPLEGAPGAAPLTRRSLRARQVVDAPAAEVGATEEPVATVDGITPEPALRADQTARVETSASDGDVDSFSLAAEAFGFGMPDS
ncbi:MAG: hypothetical protein WA971_07740, partial [Microbacterium sp.]